MKLNLILLLSIFFFTSCENDSPLNPEVNPVDNSNTTMSAPVASLLSVDSSGCYEITFPISFVYDDGTTVTANDETELESIFTTEPYPVNIGYPVNLEDPATGETAIANDETELMNLFADCDIYVGTGNPTWGDSSNVFLGYIGCYEIAFPVTFTLLDGTTATANSADDLANLFTTNNPPVDFEYPLNLVGLDDGESYTAASAEELETLILACDPFIGGGGGNPNWCDSTNVDLGFFGCYDIVFPVSFVLEDGTIATAQTEDDLEDIFTTTNPPVDFSYPINLVSLVDGQNYTAANEDELAALFAACDNFNGGGGNWGTGVVFIMTIKSISPDPSGTIPSCFTYNYPISVTLVDGGTATANDDAEMLDLVFGGTEVEDFVYPISVTEVSSGNTLTANDEAEVIALIDDCD